MLVCRDAFFDRSVVWDTDDPSVTSCMADTALAAAPCAALWTLAPVCLAYAPRSRSGSGSAASLGWRYWSRSAAGLALPVATSADLAVRLVRFGGPGGLCVADVFQFAVLFCSYVFAQFILTAETRRSLSNSATLFMFWLLLLLLREVPMLKLEIDEISGAADPARRWWWSAPRAASLALTLAQLALSSLSAPRKEAAAAAAAAASDASAAGCAASQESPEYSASFPAGIYYSWLDSLIWKGFKTPLVLESVPLASRAVDVEAIAPAFAAAWEDAARANGVSFVREKSAEEGDDGEEEEEEEEGPQGDGDRVRIISRNTRNRKSKSPGEIKLSLWLLLLRLHWRRFSFGTALGIVFCTAQLVAPTFVRLIVQHVETPEEEGWKGYFYAAALFALAAVGSLFDHAFLRQMVIVGQQMSSCLTSMIYRKSLKLSSAARRKFTSGEITNFMSVDADKVLMIPWFANCWSAPYQIAVALYLLYQELGAVVFAGLGVLVLTIPVNAWGTKKEEEKSRKLMEIKDSRIKFMNEFLAGIKVVKLYAWEIPLMKRINSIRDGEIKIFRYLGWLWGLTNFTFEVQPLLICLMVFGLYTVANPGEALTADKIFVSIALMHIIQIPMVALPWAVVNAVKMAVGVNRIQRFLNCEEVDPGTVDAEVEDRRNILELRGASFTWEDKGDEGNNCNDNGEENNVSSSPSTSDEEERNGGKAHFALRDLDLEVRRGSLVAVVGRVGSGKSTLLSSILGEVSRTSGRASVAAGISVGYAPQQAWIRNLTLRDNVLFGKAFSEERYTSVLSACSLKSDLEMLVAGDRTEIGENGINLSGGQKQRVSLARAVYSEADLYLLDDPLSAVDAHVGAHIFHHVIGKSGVLAGKTRILVTNDVKYLRHMDSIVVLREGRIAERGTYEELMDNDGAFAEFLRNYDNNKTGNSGGSRGGGGSGHRVLARRISEIRKERRKNMRQQVRKSFARQVSESYATVRAFSRSLSSSPPVGMLMGSSFDARMLQRLHSNDDDYEGVGKRTEEEKDNSDEEDEDKDELVDVEDDDDEVVLLEGATGSSSSNNNNNNSGALVEDEIAEVGRVDWRVYLHYLYKLGWAAAAAVFALHIGSQSLLSASNLWLFRWADANRNVSSSSDNGDTTALYLGVYGAMSFVVIVLLVAKDLVLFLKAATASKNIHSELLDGVSHSPMSFFDTNPVGRVVNRFSGDLEKVDMIMPWQMNDCTACLCYLLSIIVLISYTIPIFTAVILPAALVYLVIQRCYISTSRQLQRISSIVRSPIYSHFGETLSGVPSIRAYKLSSEFIKESERKVNAFAKSFYYCVIVNRWLATRIELLSAAAVLAASVFAVSARATITPGLAGLAVTYALDVTGCLTWMIRMMTDLERDSVSLERILEYSDGLLKKKKENEEEEEMSARREAEWNTDADLELPAGWPDRGEVEFENYSTRYRPGLDLVLRSVSLRVRPGEKVGVCGRTGAGKSSLALSLLRLLEPASGSVRVDGRDTRRLGLQRLRGALTTIPQDPVLFTGSLRFNLDPEGGCLDDELWEALRHASLGDLVASFSDGLEHQVTERGENFSQGQRQLICLARALLRKSKVLLLDEATAAVDLETDDLIQRAIRAEFDDCTVITIAHRLHTILDCDRVAVFSEGHLAEFAPPAELMGRSDSAFSALARDAGIL